MQTNVSNCTIYYEIPHSNQVSTMVYSFCNKSFATKKIKIEKRKKEYL